MGRFFGRRPDRTDVIARAVEHHLLPGESVVAGVDVQSAGTTSAGLQGGASAGVAAAVGAGPTFRGGEDEHEDWMSESAAVGIDPDVARTLVWVSLALTTHRLLVIRRSKLTGRLKEPVAQWPVAAIDRIIVPRQSNRLSVVLGDRTVDFEIEVADKFRPDVFRELPARLEAVKANAQRW